MARYAISVEGVASMRSLAKQLYTQANSILESCATLEAKVSAVGDGLGIYESEILGIVQQGRNTLKANREDILLLAGKLRGKAEEIEELLVLTGDAPATGGSHGVQAGSSQSGGHFSQMHGQITGALKRAGVEYRPIQLAPASRTTEEIVSQLSGGDMTEGSCSSLALAYAGNRAGYDVLDFRDGDSRSYFASRQSIQQIADLPDVQSLELKGADDLEVANQLLSTMVEGKEYYLATGEHAAIVRNRGGRYEYLELQHPSTGNGWHALTDCALCERFKCEIWHNTSFLIDVDSLAASSEFLDILGYINTAESDQRKGGAGNVR